MSDTELLLGIQREMSDGFTSVREDISGLTTKIDAHLAVHGERDRRDAASGVTKRWVITTTVAIIGGLIAFSQLILKMIPLPH